MCPMKIKIKIANFSRVVKFIFGPLKEKPRPYARAFFQSGSCHTSLERAWRVQHKTIRTYALELIWYFGRNCPKGHFWYTGTLTTTMFRAFLAFSYQCINVYMLLFFFRDTIFCQDLSLFQLFNHFVAPSYPAFPR